MVSLNANAGSAAGSTIYATVEGIGPDDKFLTSSTGTSFTYTTQYTLVTPTNFLCASSTIVAPNTIECITAADVDIGAATPISVMNLETFAVSSCGPA